jgi:hypothetical protein
MSDLETPQNRDLASTVATLVRGFGHVPQLVDEVSNLTRWAAGADLLASDISQMALAACEAELRSMRAIRSLIDILRGVVFATSGSNAPMQALMEAEQELIIAEERISKAIDQVTARLKPGESHP